MFQNMINAPKAFEDALVKLAEQELTDAGWERVTQDRWRRPDGQEFSMVDAIRVLSGGLALECGTSWPLPPA
jgi:hypothetical protein